MVKVRQPLSFHEESNHIPFFQDVAKQINGGISFGAQADPSVNSSGIASLNIDGQWAKVTSPVAPNTQFAVTHNLNRIPVGFDVKRQNLACSVYDSGTAWTTTQIFLKCSVASVTLTLFIH